MGRVGEDRFTSGRILTVVPAAGPPRIAGPRTGASWVPSASGRKRPARLALPHTPMALGSPSPTVVVKQGIIRGDTLALLVEEDPLRGSHPV